jgi:4-amino-4-deoxy-L-arabinose transferase-like glycosyltransferase
MKKLLLAALLLAALTAVVMAPVSPAVQRIPGRDAGVFLYVGSQILDGKVPYLQVWDHKQPLIFFINAAGLALSGGSLWGVWLMEVVSLLAAAALAFALLARAFSHYSAVLALIGSMLTLAVVLHGGNYTEEFALPFQFASLFLLIHSERRGGFVWRGFGIGVMVGLAFLLKQSLIGIGLAIALYLLLKGLFSERRCLLQLGLMAAGAGAVALAAVLYFWAWGALVDYWQAAFVYNQVYSNLGPLERLGAVIDELEYMAAIPGFALALAFWAAGVVLLALHHRPNIESLLHWRGFSPATLAAGLLLALFGLLGDLLIPASQPGLGLTQIASIVAGGLLALLGVALFLGLLDSRLWRSLPTGNFTFPRAGWSLLSVAVIALPLELVLISLSARNYVYYYITLIPVTTLLLAALFYTLTGLASSDGRAAGHLWAGALLVTLSLSPIIALPSQLTPGVDAQIAEAAAYVRANTAEEDTVLVWGAETMVNFLSGRRAPSRFTYLYPLYMARYASEPRVNELLQDILQQKPALIIDTRDQDTPFVDARDKSNCRTPTQELSAGMEQIFAVVCADYQFSGEIGPDRWRVYRWDGSQSQR